MGYLTATYDGIELPVKITKLNRNITPPVSNTTKQIEGKSGSKLEYSTYGAKTISIEYTIRNGTAEGISEFRRKMSEILHSEEEKRLIFSDEPNLYYDAVPDGEGILNEEYIVSEGTLTFLVPDGLAHSTTEKTFDAVTNEEGIMEVAIVNNGTESVPISYEISHNHENGYIGIVSEYGVMQYGAIEEADGENYKENETLFTMRDFFSASDDPTGTDVMHPDCGMTGSLKSTTWFDTKFLTLDDPGELTGSANGGMRTVNVPVDSNGSAECKNFYSYIHVLFQTGAMGQTGGMCINWVTADDKMIAGINWCKSDKSGNTAKYELWGNGKKLKTYEFTASDKNSENPWCWDYGRCSVKKEGSKLTFYYDGNYPTFIVPEVEEMECAKVSISMKQFGERSGSQFVKYMGVDWLRFQKMFVEKWRDVPNRYAEGSVCKIDGETGRFYVDGALALGDEITGTKYFKAPPGVTKVQFCYSDFCDPAPKITARIREAYL